MPRLKLQSTCVVLALAATLSFAPCGSAQEAPTPEPAEVATAEPAAPAKPNRAEARRQKLIAKIWWNQEKKIEHLALTAAQRQSMDEILRAFLDQRGAMAKQDKTALGLFGEALAEGDTQAVAEHRAAAAEAAAEPVRQQLDMMIAVFEELTPTQRRRFAEAYPRLLSRLWIRNAPRGLIPRGGRRQGG